MTTRDLVSLAMKIIGVYYLVQFFIYALSMLMSGVVAEQATALIPVAGILVVGLLLVFGSGLIARLLIPERRDGIVASVLSLSDWQAILFSALGVNTVVQALRYMGSYFQRPQHELQLQVFIPGIVMIIIGVLLFFQARGLANLWRSIQEHRTNEDEES